MRRYWISIITNLAYPVAGWLAGPVTGFTFTALGLASAGFHWHEHEKYALGAWWKRTAGYRWQVADRIGMYLAFWSILYVMGPGSLGQGLFCGGMFAVMAIFHEGFDKTAVGLLAAACVAVKIGRAAYTGWIVAILLSVALGLRQLGEDMGVAPDTMHGAWHIMTALAMYGLAEGFHFY